MRYRKKPPIVEAVQWFKDGDHPKVYKKQDLNPDVGCIDTIGGKTTIIYPGDWIVTNESGELFSLNSIEFNERFEPDV